MDSLNQFLFQRLENRLPENDHQLLRLFREVDRLGYYFQEYIPLGLYCKIYLLFSIEYAVFVPAYKRAEKQG